MSTLPESSPNTSGGATDGPMAFAPPLNQAPPAPFFPPANSAPPTSTNSVAAALPASLPAAPGNGPPAFPFAWASQPIAGASLASASEIRVGLELETSPLYSASMLAYPSYVVDVNKGAVLTEIVDNHDFSEWEVDLRSQVVGATVQTYYWDFGDAPEADNISASEEYDVQFEWSTFTGAPRANTISLTVDFGLVQQTQYFHFVVAATDSPAWLEAPTSLATWPDVMTPDLVQANSADVMGQHHSVDLLDGSVTTEFAMPSYNPGVPGLRLVYNSMTANPAPVFQTRFEIDPNQAVPESTDAIVTIDGTVAGTELNYNTSADNPGNILHFPLSVDATSLATGRYDWEVEVIANYSTPDTTTFDGQFNLINDSASQFGAGWWLDGLDRLYEVEDGMMLVMAGNRSLYFEEDAGRYITPAGDFSTLEFEEIWTRTLHDGTVFRFGNDGLLFEREDRNGNITTYTYSSGRLATIEDPNGLDTTFTYVSGKLDSIEDGAGRVSEFVISSGELISATDPAGGLWEFDYTSALLTEITDPREEVTEFVYDGAKVDITNADSATEAVRSWAYTSAEHIEFYGGTVLLAALTADHRDGNANTWQQRLDWSGFGQTMQTINPLGNVAIQFHDANGQMWLDSDELARRNVYHHEEDGDNHRITWADDNFEEYSFNGFGQVTEFIDARGNPWTFDYDADGNLEEFITPEGNTTGYTYNGDGFVETITDPRNYVTTFKLDSRNRVTSIIDAEDGEVEFVYTAASNVESMTDQRDFVTLYEYDDMNRVTKMTLPDEDANSKNNPVYSYSYNGISLETVTDPLTNKTTYAYDPMGRLKTVSDPLDHETNYDYDGNGNLVGITDALSHVVNFEYNPANQLTFENAELGRITEYELDAAGQVTMVTDPEGGETQFIYDQRGWVSGVIDPTGHANFVERDPNGNPVTQGTALVIDKLLFYSCAKHCIADYNLDNLQTKVTTHDGTTVTTFDESNNVTKVSMACGCSGMSEGIYEYDGLNRKISSTNNLDLTTDYGYDPASNLILITDPLGHETEYEHDAQNRVKTTTNGEGGVTAFDYYLDGRLKSVIDPENNETGYKYDDAGRLTVTTDPNIKETTNVYDAANRLTDIYDRNDRRIQFSWDDANRLIGETWYDSGKNVVNEVEYDYDLADRLTLAADDVARNEMTYWLDGRLKTQTTTESTTTLDMELTYYYGSEQNHHTPVLTSITDDFSGGVTYETTEAGRLTGAILHVGYDDVAEAQLTYTAQGWLETVTLTDEDFLGQIITTYDHDDAGRVKSITHEHDDFTTVSSLAEFEYVWDDGNRIESYTGPEGDREYVYDKTNQLLEVSEPGVGVLEEFDFDANGNRDSTGYVTTDGNRLVEDGTFEYIYDNEGNLISKTHPVNYDEWEYTWDNRNRLIHVTATDTNPATSPTVFYEATYTYDVFNRRIGVLEDEDGDGGKPAEQLWTVYDGNNAYADFDENGDMTTRYLNGRAMDQRFARYDVGTDETAFYLTDLINSVRLIADAEGNVLYEADYSAFGLIVSQSGTGGDRFTYTGRELDGTGDYYYRARYYGAGVGRFLSEDPIEFVAGDTNLYRYVLNMPNYFRDATGLRPNPGNWLSSWVGMTTLQLADDGYFIIGTMPAKNGAISGKFTLFANIPGAIGGAIGGGLVGGFWGWWKGSGFWCGAAGGLVGGGLAGGGVPPWIASGAGAAVTEGCAGKLNSKKAAAKICAAALGGPVVKHVLGDLPGKFDDGFWGQLFGKIILGGGMAGWTGIVGKGIDAALGAIGGGQVLGPPRNRAIDDLADDVIRGK